MKEIERNKRLFVLLNKLVINDDLKSIELIETWIENDSPSMKKSFQIVKDGGNFDKLTPQNKV